MGTWGSGAFANDAALDWMADLVKAADLARVRGVLSDVLRTTDEPEAETSQQALAAAEVVAALRGFPARDLPDELKDWVDDASVDVSPELVKMAVEAVARVGADSELARLWARSDPGDWSVAVGDLSSRLDRC